MSGGLQPIVLLSVIAAYFIILFVISYLTSRRTDNDTFFRANRNSPWVLVAVGMIGSSLSGVTFISIPGVVGMGGANMAFSYMQMVFGYLLGYLIIATVLMPIYYKHNLTSIYGYLEGRFGSVSYKTGSAFFLLSRLIGSAFRLYLVAIVLDRFVLGPLGIPFWLTVFLTLLLIWLYTNRGGIKTIIITDVFQTIGMLLAVALTIYFIADGMSARLSEIPNIIRESDYSRIFFMDKAWSDPNNFFKQFVSGALIALVMTGLDQDMMQKNLTCRSLGDAQKNMGFFSIILVFSNLLFLSLGALMFIYASKEGIEIPGRSDYLYPTLALEHLPAAVGIIFILGLIAAAYSSADSALTALTTAFCVDFLNLEKRNLEDKTNQNIRKIVHIAFAILSFLVIILFNQINNDAVINGVFKAAGYTYGPLLGLFAFGVLTHWQVRDKYVWLICIFSPVVSYILDTNSSQWFNGFTFGYLNLLLNGFLTFAGLMLLRKK